MTNKNKEKLDNPKNFQTAEKHLLELRNKLIFSTCFFFLSFIICYIFSKEIYNFLLEPFVKISEGKVRKLIYTHPSEAFLTYLKLAFKSAIFISLPIFLSQIYLYLSPALYKSERKNILSIIFLCSFLFLIGSVICYYFILPIALKFFIGFEISSFENSNSNILISLETKISEYFNFVYGIILGFGIAFQLPSLVVLLVKAGIIKAKSLQNKRRYLIILIFVISAILTPPDIISQVSLAILLILLLEISLFFIKDKKH